MKNIPNKIYLQVDPEKENPDDFNELREVTFCVDKINDNDIEYCLPTQINDMYKILHYQLLLDYETAIINRNNDKAEKFAELADLVQKNYLSNT